MKIDYQKQLARVFDNKAYINSMLGHIKEHEAQAPEGAETTREHDKLVRTTLSTAADQAYLLTESARAVIDKVSVTAKFDVTLLARRVDTKIYLFYVGENLAYKIGWGDNVLVVSKVWSAGHVTEGHNILMRSMVLDLRKRPAEYKQYNQLGEYIRAIEAQPEEGAKVDIHTSVERLDDMDPASLDQGDLLRVASEAIRILLFLELTDPTFLVIPAGKKFSARPMGTSSTAPSAVTVVTSKWNFHLVRTEGFAVSGHYRAQRVGQGLSRVEMVWVRPYEKKGLTIKAKSKPSELEGPLPEGVQEPPI